MADTKIWPTWPTVNYRLADWVYSVGEGKKRNVVFGRTVINGQKWAGWVELAKYPNLKDAEEDCRSFLESVANG